MMIYQFSCYGRERTLVHFFTNNENNIFVYETLLMKSYSYTLTGEFISHDRFWFTLPDQLIVYENIMYSNKKHIEIIENVIFDKLC